ncbi:Suppressor of the cold-sensitive snRNP bioproteinsis mutant brr1-1, partial [Perkinsus olseni]
VNYIVTRRVEVSSHSYTSDGTYRTLEAAMKRASDRGHLMFAAAGNDGRDITIAKTYPCAYSQTVEYLLCVGSTDMYARNRLARESNFGRYVDIAAPGVGIPSTYIGSLYSYMSGTSMATPHIAGIAALLSGLGLSPADIKEVLLASTEPVYYFGGNRVGNFGKVNAARAVELALTKPTVRPNDERSVPARECIKVYSGAKQEIDASKADIADERTPGTITRVTPSSSRLLQSASIPSIVDVRSIPNMLADLLGTRRLTASETTVADCLSNQLAVKSVLTVGVQVIDTASSNCNTTREKVCQYLEDASETLNIGAICEPAIGANCSRVR